MNNFIKLFLTFFCISATFFGIYLTLPIQFHDIFMLVICSTLVATTITFACIILGEIFKKL